MRDKALIARAKRLRRQPTIAEHALWQRLRGHRLKGLGFRRQADVCGYVVDFVCHAPRLVVEIDGPVHDDAERQAFDALRDAAMEEAGFAVLRVKERAVRVLEDQVVEKIAAVAVVLLQGRAMTKSELRFG